MGAPEFIISALASSGNQVRKVLEGISGDQWDARLVPSTMSPRETVEHLAMCYEAFKTEATGGKWDWTAPFDLGITDPGALVSKMLALRDEAVELAKASDDPKVYEHVLDFLLSHDSYHVGQMAALRIAQDPSWPPYSIYQ